MPGRYTGPAEPERAGWRLRGGGRRALCWRTVPCCRVRHRPRMAGAQGRWGRHGSLTPPPSLLHPGPLHSALPAAESEEGAMLLPRRAPHACASLQSLAPSEALGCRCAGLRPRLLQSDPPRMPVGSLTGLDLLRGPPSLGEEIKCLMGTYYVLWRSPSRVSSTAPPRTARL